MVGGALIGVRVLHNSDQTVSTRYFHTDNLGSIAVQHAMFEMVMSRVLAIACGHEDAIDLDRLRHDPLMKLAVGRCAESGQPLASQSTISRLENAPSKTEAARLTAALLDQFATTVTPGQLEILEIDDTFCAAHGGQQLRSGMRITTSAALR
jgi:hypothetical protein